MNSAETYAASMASQLRKGFLTYCVLRLCSQSAPYAAEILRLLAAANMKVSDGTIYPLLNRLHKDGLLMSEWQESPQGPPRKYYRQTDYGYDVAWHMERVLNDMQVTLSKI